MQRAEILHHRVFAGQVTLYFLADYSAEFATELAIAALWGGGRLAVYIAFSSKMCLGARQRSVRLMTGHIRRKWLLMSLTSEGTLFFAPELAL